MCAVSAVGDYWKDQFPQKYPGLHDYVRPYISQPSTVIPDNTRDIAELQKEIKAVRAELLELKKLLQAAIDFDEATNQPHCETDEKVALLKKVAELVGVDLSELK